MTTKRAYDDYGEGLLVSRLKPIIAPISLVLLFTFLTLSAAHAQDRPQALIDGAPDAIKSNIVGTMTGKGFSISRDTQFQLAFDKPADNILVMALLGSRYDIVPNERVTFTFAPNGAKTMVFADIAIITNPGSGFERVTPISGQEAQNVQGILTTLSWERTPKTDTTRNMGLRFINFPNQPMRVIEVTPGTPAARAGVQTDDVIVEVNGKPVEDGMAFYDETVHGSKDQTMTVQRKGARLTLAVHFAG